MELAEINKILTDSENDTVAAQQLMRLFEDECENVWDYCYEQGTRNVGHFNHNGGVKLKTEYFNRIFKNKKLYL